MNPILQAIKDEDLVTLQRELDAAMDARALEAIDALRPAVMAKIYGKETQEDNASPEQNA